MKWFGPFSLTWWPPAVIAMSSGCLLVYRWIQGGITDDKRAESYSELFAIATAFLSDSTASTFASNRLLAILFVVCGVTAMVSVGVRNVLDSRKKE